MNPFTIVIPAKNEAVGLRVLLPELRTLYPEAEIIVVNDGSTDETGTVVKDAEVVTVVHEFSKGNGASIKAGARCASNDLVVFMDADGQHSPKDVARLKDKMQELNADMVVGARSRKTQANAGRLIANTFYNKLASWISSNRVEDLTSGFRIVKKDKFMKFLYLLPNGFSYPTTVTMAFFRAGHKVAYLDIEAGKRKGASHISIFRDGIRFLLIIFKIGTLFSPLKIFFPMSCLFFLTGLLYYLYTYLSNHSLTNMGAILFISSFMIFLIGLVSEQITTLMYKDSE